MHFLYPPEKMKLICEKSRVIHVFSNSFLEIVIFCFEKSNKEFVNFELGVIIYVKQKSLFEIQRVELEFFTSVS